MHRVSILAISVLLLGCSPRTAAPPVPPAATGAMASAERVVRAMHERYRGKWYRTLTFVQHNTETRPDGSTHRSIWYEALSLPGRLRIDFEPIASGNGMLFASDTQYIVQNAVVTRRARLLHPLLLLGFDIYELPPERSMAALRELGFDLSVIHEDVWGGRPVWVVGAPAGDLRRRQFWIDRDRLVFVRSLEPQRRDTTKVFETRFNKYVPLGGGWVAPEVEFLVDGRRQFFEEYADVRADVDLDPSLFDPTKWRAAKHWKDSGNRTPK